MKDSFYSVFQIFLDQTRAILWTAFQEGKIVFSLEDEN